MRVCPFCHRLFEDNITICPHDSIYLERPMDSRVGTMIDKYRVMGPMGSGGMGTVYRAEHVFIGKDVALKVLKKEIQTHEQLVRRFLMEARAASMIHHQNIVNVTDFGVTLDGCSYCVMEYLEGPNLATVLEEGAMPLFRIVNILSQAAHALSACHKAGIVHRDLKPENLVLMQQSGRRELLTFPRPDSDWVLEREKSWDLVKVLDFGVASVQSATSALDDESRALGIVFGSPDYISPEQAMGKPGDQRSDVYSMGVILYEMLTGDVPFTGSTAKDVMLQHVKTPPVPPDRRRPDLDIPPEAVQLVLKALAKLPEHRVQTMEEFYWALKGCHGKTIYRRDLKEAMHKYRQTVRRLPIPSEADAHPGRRELVGEIKQYLRESTATPSPLDGRELPTTEESDGSEIEELRRLLRQDEEDL